MNQNSSKSKYILSIAAAILTACAFLFLYFYIGVSQRDKTYEDSKWIAIEQSRNAAGEVESFFIKAIMTARSLTTQSIVYYKEKANRNKVVELLKKYTAQNPDFLALWTLWEPNFYDGNDSKFKNAPYYNREGHLSVTFFYHNDSLYSESTSPDDYQEFFYTIPKETKQELVLEPYKYQYQGYPYEFYETTVVEPIIIDSLFAGVFAIDLDIKKLQERFNKIKLYNNGYLALISANGEIVAHKDSNYIAKNLFKLINPSDTIPLFAFKNGIEYSYETHSEFTGEDVFRILYPIRIGKSNKRWFIMSEISKREATIRSVNMYYVSLGVLVLGLLLILYLIYNIFDRLEYEKNLIKAKEFAEQKERDLQKMYYELQASEEELRATNEELYSTSEALKENNTQLLKAKEEAEEANRLKTAFLHNLSHEVRTPLNAISGFAQVILKFNNIDEELKNFTHIIHSSSKQLVSIINDIITISSIETGQEKIISTNIHLNQLIEELKTVFDLQLKGRPVELKIQKALANGDDEILVDVNKLRQILNNLLSNAVKFTQQGTIEFGYALKDNNLEFFVKDTGIGIDKTKHSVIFERFTQADEQIHAIYGGTGLGLSICKGFVELLGGNIWVESELGKGSTFFFSLPYIPVISSAKQNQPTQPKNQNETMTILVAEDDINSFKLLRALLKDYNCQIIHADTGTKAVELCKQDGSINLVLMDIKMPEMDGVTATRLIKEINPKITVIAQTAYATLDDIEKNKDVFDAYITKPIDVENLKRILNQFLNNWSNGFEVF